LATKVFTFTITAGTLTPAASTAKKAETAAAAAAASKSASAPGAEAPQHTHAPNGWFYEQMGGISLDMSPDSPSLLERLTNNPEGKRQPPNAHGRIGWHVLEVVAGDIVDIVLNNHEPFGHPFHLHGHGGWAAGSFYVSTCQPLVAFGGGGGAASHTCGHAAACTAASRPCLWLGCGSNLLAACTPQGD
jgi:hypothetical protein